MSEHALPTNEVHAEALRCLDRGWAVIPVAEKGKDPHYAALKQTRGTTKTQPFFDNPADREEVSRWWEEFPAANLGVVCGSPSKGLAVLDFDGGNLPPAQLLRGHPTVVTGRGSHVYFAADDGLRTKKAGNTSGLERVKAEGYVVGPTSTHRSGAVYEWVRTPEETGLLTLPMETQEVLLSLALHRERTPREAPIPSLTRKTGYNSLALAAWDWNEEFVSAFCRSLGVPLRGAFRCVLPGHTDHRASAGVWKADDGRYLYKDFHRADETYLLSEVYAAVETGNDISEVRDWGKPTLLQWQRKLLVDLGFETPAKVVIPPLPYGAPESARKVYEGVRGLFGIRGVHGDADDPAPLTRTFLATWLGMSEASVTLGKGFLIQHKIISPVGKHGRMTLWLPGKENPC